ncbi:MAG: hypothetical protein L0J45_07560 [Psychroflexus sp.]|nr:hypothetical protein [Psychroflexus sp.]
MRLTIIGSIAGIVLMLFLKIILIFTGNSAYILLFNFDYIPVLNDMRPIWLFGYVFHFLTCILSVVALYNILKAWGWEKLISPYILVFTLGGGALFFLTALSDQLPEASDKVAWIYWTLGHAVFGYTVGVLMKFNGPAR